MRTRPRYSDDTAEQAALVVIMHRDDNPEGPGPEDVREAWLYLVDLFWNDAQGGDVRDATLAVLACDGGADALVALDRTLDGADPAPLTIDHLASTDAERHLVRHLEDVHGFDVFETLYSLDQARSYHAACHSDPVGYGEVDRDVPPHTHDGTDAWESTSSN